MAKASQFCHLDSMNTQPLVMPQSASIALVRDIESRQHALMSGWNPGVCVDFYLSTGVGTTVTITTRVPPDCVYADIGLALWGTGDITLTTSADATGVKFRADTRQNEESAVWLWTGGVISSSLGAESGRALQMRSAASWIWNEVDITAIIANVSTGFGAVSLVVAPLHLPV